MKNKIIKLTAWLLTLALSGTGCAAIPAGDADPAKAADTAAAPEKDENGRKLLDAFVRNDPEAFTAELPEALRPQFGPKQFENARTSLTETLGEPVSYDFETKLEHPAFDVSLWKVRFERRGEDGRIINQEALFRVISGTLDGKPVIISFNFL